MKGRMAFLLVTLGAVLASLGVARTDPSVQGWVSAYQAQTGLAVAGLVLLAGGIWVRQLDLRDLRRARVDSGSLGTAAAALDHIVERTRALSARLGAIDDLVELHGLLDAIVSGPVTEFTRHRQAIIDAYGQAAYAAVMGPFSQGERYLNRAWSASTDGYLYEATTYAEKALPHIDEAQHEMQRLSADR